MYQVTNSQPLYYALRKVEGNVCTYYYFKEELKDGQTTEENPNRGIEFYKAFKEAMSGNLEKWTKWDNVDAPKEAKIALIPAVQKGSTATFQESNLDILPLSSWQRVDITQATVENWKRYQYTVNGLLITEFDNATFYYHDKKSKDPAKAWVEFIPKRGESNIVNDNLDTSQFPQTPTRLSDEEVRANRAAHNNEIVEYMVHLYHSNLNKYKDEIRHYQAQNPEFAKRISGAVLTSYQDEGKKVMLVTVIAAASPLILFAAIEAGAYVGANLTREGVYQFAKELLVEEVITTPIINGIEALTGLPLSTFADIKDAKNFIKDAWRNLINSSLFKKTIDDNFEAIKTAAEKQQKNGGNGGGSGNGNGGGDDNGNGNNSQVSGNTGQLSTILQQKYSLIENNLKGKGQNEVFYQNLLSEHKLKVQQDPSKKSLYEQELDAELTSINNSISLNEPLMLNKMGKIIPIDANIKDNFKKVSQNLNAADRTNFEKLLETHNPNGVPNFSALNQDLDLYKSAQANANLANASPYSVGADGKIAFKDTSKPQPARMTNPVNVDASCLSHSNVGEFPLDPKYKDKSPIDLRQYNKMRNGGHGQDNIAFMDNINQQAIQQSKPKIFNYQVTRTYSNGVRVGFISEHSNKIKNGTRLDANGNLKLDGQSWFPESWTSIDIKNAGDYVINNCHTWGVDWLAHPDGPPPVYGWYKGVKVGVMKTNGKPATIFPDGNEQ